MEACAISSWQVRDSLPVSSRDSLPYIEGGASAARTEERILSHSPSYNPPNNKRTKGAGTEVRGARLSLPCRPGFTCVQFENHAVHHGVRLGFGRIAASEVEAPNLFVNLV